MKAGQAVALPHGTGLRSVGADAPRDRWLLMRLLALGQSTPRLADRLIDERGSLGSVLATSDERLRQLGADSNGIALLSLIRETLGAVLERDPRERVRIDPPTVLVDMLHGAMAHLPVEQVRVAYLDARRQLDRIEMLATGTVRAAAVYPREIARRALELGAAAIILVHNHPSGDPTPSQGDIMLTKRVAQALETIDVDLADHIVIARSGHVSLRESGLF
ncbi:MAG: RadC family protein [Sphingomonadaceae bacterium]